MKICGKKLKMMGEKDFWVNHDDGNVRTLGVSGSTFSQKFLCKAPR